MNESIQKRLISLDAFRGITIMLMILVNNPGTWKHVYPPLLHAKWHGLTPADLVFPFFLFIMGTAMAFSFRRRLDENKPSVLFYTKILRRTFLLIAIGMFLGLYPQFDFNNMRIPGVLQRIGLCYFFVSMIVIHFKSRGQWIWIAALLLGFWPLMTLIPFPGHVGEPWALGSNFAQFIDNVLLKGHLGKPDFDPEGLISTIPAVAQTLLGYRVGRWLQSDREPLAKINGMFVAANALLFLGLILSLWMPVNKQLWTSSYVLVTTGAGLHVLTVCYWLMDVRGWKAWAKPFVIFGSNAIFVYALSSLTTSTLIGLIRFTTADGPMSLWSTIYQNIHQPIFGDTLGSLMFAVIYVLLWLSILSILYKKKVFVRI